MKKRIYTIVGLYPYKRTAAFRMIGQVLFVFAIALAVSFPQDVKATHLVGGTLSYRCLGGNQYEITLVYRRDCNLGAPGTEYEPTASINFFDLTTNARLLTLPPPFIQGNITVPHDPIDTANQVLINDCTLAGDDLCVQQAIYRRIVTLPPRATGYKMVYQRCCRNMSLNNIVDPLNTGMTLVAELSGQAQQVCNSSPQFENFPPIFICVDVPLEFQFEATDENGDSLVYELFTPLVGATDDDAQPVNATPPPYDSVVWLDPPYNIDNLMGGVPLTINRQTGFMTGTPNLIGQFLVGVRVLSFRNGQIIEKTTREWQFNVRPCQQPPTPVIDAEGLLNCDGLSVHITESSVNAYHLTWIMDYPDGERFTDSIIDYTYDEPGFYTIALIVSSPDSLCPDTAFGTVGVFNSQLSADFELDIPKCDLPIIVQGTDLSIDPDPDYDVTSWEWILTYPNMESDTQYTPVALFSSDTAFQGATLTLIATSETGCTDTVSVTFNGNVLYLPFPPSDTVGICEGDSVPLFLTPGPTGPDITYIWDPLTGLDTTNPNYPIAFADTSQVYHVTITDGLCEITDSVELDFTPIPVLNFDSYTDCRSLSVEFQNNSTDGFNFLWDFGDTELSLEENPTHTYEQPGNYIVTLYSADVNCNVSIVDTITVSVISDSLDRQTVSCFSDPVFLNPDGSGLYSYMWSPGEFLDNDTIPNPLADVKQTTTFYVTITDNALPGCSVVDSVLVIEGQDFELNVPGDSSYCEAPEVTLNAGNDDVLYVWLTPEGDTLAIGPELVTQPDVPTSYIITGTDSLGCMKSDTVTLNPTFIEVEANTADSIIVCFGDSTVLSVMNLDPDQTLTYQWEPEDVIIGGSTDSSIIAMPGLSDVTYYVTITNQLGCTLVDSIHAEVSLFELELSPTVLICKGEEIELQVGNFGSDSLSFMWTPTDDIEPGTENTSSPTVYPNETTTYIANVTNLETGCETTLEVTVFVSWFNPEDLEIFVSDDTIILNDTVFFLSTNQDPVLDFFWEGSPDIDDPFAPEIIIDPLAEGGYDVMVTIMNEDGCVLTGQVSLTVIDPPCDMNTVFIPDAFSPNGDGMNDELLVYGNYIESLELYIYNRWGEKVFETRDINGSWDGTFGGKELPADVFGYYMRVVCAPNKPFFKKGNITLFR